MEADGVFVSNNRAVQNGRHGLLVAGARGEQAQQLIAAGNVCAENGENGIRSYLTDGAFVASNYSCNNEKAGIELARTAKHVRLEGNYIEVKAGRRAVEDRSLKRW